MKGVAKILLGAFTLFMILAVAQEWSFFSSAWFGTDSATEQPLDEQGAMEALRHYLNMMRHFHSSQGDPRFLERIPAAESVLEELLADVDYLKRNHRYQVMDLVELQVLKKDPRGEDRLEITTKEYWIIKTLWLGTDEPSDRPFSRVAQVTYRMQSERRQWQVVGWDVVPEPPPPALGEPLTPPDGG